MALQKDQAQKSIDIIEEAALLISGTESEEIAVQKYQGRESYVRVEDDSLERVVGVRTRGFYSKRILGHICGTVFEDKRCSTVVFEKQVGYFDTRIDEYQPIFSQGEDSLQ